jgi:hypothetical protein
VNALRRPTDQKVHAAHHSAGRHRDELAIRANAVRGEQPWVADNIDASNGPLWSAV